MGILDGRVAIVTGASRGIGAAIARRLAAEGASVAVAARTEEPSESPLPGTIRATAADIAAAGGVALPVRADLSKPEDRRHLVEVTERELGPVDILVNNAAVTFYFPTGAFPERRWNLMFEVQVWAAVDLAQRVLPAMLDRRRGWILNVSSTAARHSVGPPFRRRRTGGTVYGMCKAALERFTTGLAAEVFEDGIAVNALSPSRVVATPGAVYHGLVSQAVADATEPEELMAEASLALCSGDPATLTGRIAYSQELVAELGLSCGGAARLERGYTS